MDKAKNLYGEVAKHKKIYSLMYSPSRVDHRTLGDQIDEIPFDELVWNRNKDKFFYIWGSPGPDFCSYDWSTYGKGWAFTKKEIFESWGECEE